MEEQRVDSCYLCGCRDFGEVSGTVRDNPKLKILKCGSCNLVFLSSFSHVNNGFYELSKWHTGLYGEENDIDVDAYIKDRKPDAERYFGSLKELIANKSILDFGCGTGEFLIKAKKVAKKAVGLEREEKLKSRFKREKLDVYSDLIDVPGNFDIITLLHVLEHLPDPVNTLRKLSGKLGDKGQIIVEVPNANEALIELYQCESFSHFTYMSGHLFLFSTSTLARIGEKAGLKVNYVKQVQRYPLSNHLYWLSKGIPGGHEKWAFLDSCELQSAYEERLASIGCCDTLLASFSID